MSIRGIMMNSRKNRLHRSDTFWNDKKKNFALGVAASFLMIQLLFLGLLCYLYGSIYQAGERTHNLNVLMVDYDGGVIGESLRSAVTSLAGPTFPAVSEKSVSDYPTPDHVVHAVRTGTWWAAVFTTSGSSQRLSDALTGGSLASQYNASDVITYVYNEARYATTEDGYIVPNMESLVSVARVVYNKVNGTYAVRSVNTTSQLAVQALLNPITVSSINIKPTPQATKALYNTVSMVMPIILQFFFLMAVNGVSSQYQLYSHLSVRDNGIIRFGLATSYTFIGALCHTAYQYAFLESNWLTAGQFFLALLIVWIYMHINFLVIDCATAFISMSFVPFFFFTWVVINVTSSIFPFELNPGFYRWGYALPAFETYQALVTIWSGGAADTLYRALPILFAWEVVLLPSAMVALHYRCVHAAKLHEENEERMRSIYGQPAPSATTEDTAVEKQIQIGHGVEDTVASPLSQQLEAADQYYPQTPVPFQNTLERLATTK